jgi:hypothetical protein
LVAGGLGSGAGLIADVIADVVRLSLGRVERRRKAIGADRQSLTVERLDIDPTAAERRRGDNVGLAILCDAQAETAFSEDATDEAAITAEERVVVDKGVPAWRQNLLPAQTVGASSQSDGEPARLRSIFVAARGVAVAGRKLPYDRALWRRSLARHVPKRHREAALAKFDAEFGV